MFKGSLDNCKTLKTRSEELQPAEETRLTSTSELMTQNRSLIRKEKKKRKNSFPAITGSRLCGDALKERQGAWDATVAQKTNNWFLIYTRGI